MSLSLFRSLNIGQEAHGLPVFYFKETKLDRIARSATQGIELNMRRTEILKEHSNSIWYSKKKSDIENLLCDHYINLEKQSQENADKRNMTSESLFYEFMEYKKNLVKRTYKD